MGIRAVDPGQYVASGTKLVTLQSLDPIYADFYLPQQDLAQIAVGQSVEISTSSSAEPSVAGKIEAVNPQIDINTRNVQVRARLSNSERKLLPGMFVNVSITTSDKKNYLTLPQTAIVYNPYGASVFVIKSSGAALAADGKASASHSLTVQQQFVETGPTRGDQVAIIKGIQLGDSVVTSGQLKLKNGAAVVIDNSLPPPNDPKPAPQNE